MQSSISRLRMEKRKAASDAALSFLRSKVDFGDVSGTGGGDAAVRN